MDGVGEASGKIAEWNNSLKKANRVDFDLVREAREGEPCDVTLRWEDERFFTDWRERDADGNLTGKGADLRESSGYGSAEGNGSINETDQDPTAPYQPGRDLEKFPEGEAYFNTDPPRPHRVLPDAYVGWFVDPTPEDDTEFDEQGGETPETADKTFWKAKRDGDAANAWDFLTAMIHEFGHMLGMRHKGQAGDPDSDCGQVMADGAGDRERRHVPDSTVGFEERRHVSELDEQDLRNAVLVEPDGLFGRIRIWLRRILRFLLGR